MHRRYWMPAVVLLLLGLIFYFGVYAYGFTGVLLCLAAAGVAVFGAVDALKGRFPRAMKHLHRMLCVGLALVLLAAVGTGIWIGVCASGSENIAEDYVIVLGAGVNVTAPSQSLRERLEAAQAYLEAYPEAVCILSGGQGDYEDITEAQCMFNWLTERGIDKERLRMEEQAGNTEENLAFSLALIEAETGMRPARAAVISSEYHLLRAELLGRQQGISLSGYPAHTENRIFFCNMFLREICGVWVTLLRFLF